MKLLQHSFLNVKQLWTCIKWIVNSDVKIYLLFCAKTLQAYVETFAVNNDIYVTFVSITWNLIYTVSKLGVIFFGGDTLYITFNFFKSFTNYHVYIIFI